MRILVAYRHFWPDSPPYSSILRSLGAELAKDGHDVSILAEQPSYKSVDREKAAPASETFEGMQVRRLAGLPLPRTLRSALFPIRVVLNAVGRRLRGERYDLMWTTTVPPGLNGPCVALAARILGARFMYHLQDVYPDLAGYAGEWRRGSPVYRLVGMLERHARRRAARCIVLSEDMADTLVENGTPREKIVIVNNFIEEFPDPVALPPQELRPAEGTFRVIFAGNIGRFQGVEALVDAARLLEHELPDVEIMLLGEGKALPSLRERGAGLSNLVFAPHMPFEQARTVIASADLGLVSLRPGIYRTAYPTKALGYFALGVPALAVMEPESAMARLIVDERVGAVAEGNDGPAIAAAIRRIYADRADMPAMRERALALYDAEMSERVSMERWRALIAELERDNPS